VADFPALSRSQPGLAQGHSHVTAGGSALLSMSVQFSEQDKITLMDGQRGEGHSLAQSGTTPEKQVLHP